VADISLGQVGLVLVTELSRLSRLNSDWHRVLELCAVFETLITDGDGLYDPRDPNDRLLLGLKGTLFAAELHILQARMRGGLLNKARRGALVLRLPIGYTRLHDGSVVKDPNERVRLTIETIFEKFDQLKSARAVQRYFQAQKLQMPGHVQCGNDYGQLLWREPSYLMIQQVLTSPVYAGIFVYGRRREQIIPGDPPHRQCHRLPEEEWEIVLENVYPAYISVDQYHQHRRWLQNNIFNFAKKGQGAAREGLNLLQGLVVCGRCGRRMTVLYGGGYPGYVCRREKANYGTPTCQNFSAHYLDSAVSEAFLVAIQPVSLEAALAGLAQLETERARLQQHWQLKLEQAGYAVRLAQRQYDAVDPENRLVARELEKRWNEALSSLSQLEQEYAVVKHTELAPLSEAEREAVRQLATDLPAVWQAESTTLTERKRLLRLVITQVCLTVDQAGRHGQVVISWCGGASSELSISYPPAGWHCVTDAGVVERLRELAPHWPDYAIAQKFNQEGILTRTGKEWTHERVRTIRRQHNIPTGCTLDPVKSEPRGDGLVPVKTAARLLGVSLSLVNLWAQHGVLVSEQRITGSYLWVRVNESDQVRLSGVGLGTQYPRFKEVRQALGVSNEALWEQVKAGHYTAWRVRLGQNWEWRLEKRSE
jgi:DNA invertase Pin-like site-specific DNA recombinase